MRRPFICGNWKMNGTLAESRKLLTQFDCLWDEKYRAVDIAVCPPYTALYVIVKALRESHLDVGAQNCFSESKGAFTGEVSPEMLAEVGCRYVILGHSERRTMFQESDAIIAAKAQVAVASGLQPIICVGESEAERANDETEAVLEKQISGSLATISAEDAPTLIVAYEPVWAIGTGKTASKEQAQAAHSFIRTQLSNRYGSNVAAQIRILYGGSMKPENAQELLSSGDIDGGLIGGASLNADSFMAIVDAAYRSIQ